MKELGFIGTPHNSKTFCIMIKQKNEGSPLNLIWGKQKIIKKMYDLHFYQRGQLQLTSTGLIMINMCSESKKCTKTV